MSDQPIWIRRVGLKNYMSIAECSASLRRLNFLAGQTGSGKSNFLDAFRFTADALNYSVEYALRQRGGIGEVRRRSIGPTHFGIHLEWELPTGETGVYSFRISPKSTASFEIQREFCEIANPARPLEPAGFEVQSGRIVKCTFPSPPSPAPDRLFLAAATGQPQFRILYDALTRMGFYKFNPDVLRELQLHDPGEILAGDGRNLASVLERLSAQPGGPLPRITELLGKIVPGITHVNHKPLGKRETLEFRQSVPGSNDVWRFEAQNMSDGTLQALAVLIALFQPGTPDGRAIRLIGIEEPAASLHPGAAAALRSALIEASRNIQILATSHSPDLFDDKNIAAESILFVTQQSGATVISTVDETTRAAIRGHLHACGEFPIPPAPVQPGPSSEQTALFKE